MHTHNLPHRHRKKEKKERQRKLWKDRKTKQKTNTWKTYNACSHQNSNLFYSSIKIHVKYEVNRAAKSNSSDKKCQLYACHLHNSGFQKSLWWLWYAQNNYVVSSW